MSRATAESKDAIGCLRVEQVGLLANTAKNKVERVLRKMIVLTEVHLIENHEALVVRSLSVTLIKAAVISAIGGALAILQIFMRAVVLVASRAPVELVPRVHVRATRRISISFALLLAVVVAGHSGDRAARVHDQVLLLAVRANSDRSKEVLKVGAVSAERRRLQVLVQNAVRILTQAPVQSIRQFERHRRFVVLEELDSIERDCILVVHDLLRIAAHTCRTKK